jgi:hypothetical protein
VTAPAWLGYVLAAAMLAVAGYCAVRLAAFRRLGRATEFDTDAMHVVMGVAMAGMLVARLRFVPPVAGAVVFAGGAAWFGWRILVGGRAVAGSPSNSHRPTAHLVECAAMCYMYLILPAAPRPGAGMSAVSVTQTRFALLALVAIVYLAGSAVRQIDRFPVVVISRADGSSAAIPFLAPRCAALCKIAMAVTMSYTLILML